jgi:hypothetical protein
MLTVKSDDVDGRVKTYEANVKGEDVIHPGVPESFHVLLKELQGLGLSVELLNQEQDDFALSGDITKGALTAGPEGGVWGGGVADEEALAAAASLLAETTDMQDEAVLAADGWTDSPTANTSSSDSSSDKESENPEEHGFSEESPEESEDAKKENSEPSNAELDDEEKEEESEE